MERLEDTPKSGVVMLDAAVVHDIATACTGNWSPADETDEARQAQIVAAARIRVYADRDQYGWYLAATAQAREESMGYEGAAWSVDFIQDVSTFADAPPEHDITALEKILREAGVGGASARCLAAAILYEPATYVITHIPAEMKHSRAHDLPPRLEIVDPVEAVAAALQLVAGEIPVAGPPQGSKVDAGPHWWVP